MRPLHVSLAALALSTAAGPLADTLHAQERTRTPTPQRERVRSGDVIVDRGDGWTRIRSWGDENRAMLGVSLGAGDDRGVRVVEVSDDGPAAKAGIEEGDRIVSINGTVVTVSREDADDPELQDLGARRLTRALGALKPGDEVTLVVARGSERRTVRVKTVAGSALAEGRGARVFSIPGGSGYVFGRDSAGRATAEARIRAWRDSARVQAERRPARGLSVQASGTVRDTLGLFVGSITSGGPAEKAGLVEGDRIAAINDVDVRVPREDVEDRPSGSARASRFTRELRKAKPGDDLRLRVFSEGRYRTLTVKVGRAVDVFRSEGGMSFGFGDGDTFLRPSRVPMPPMPPMAPMAPMRGRVQLLRAPRPALAPTAPAAPRAPLPPSARTLRRWTEV
ncbi:MAG: PDZ domain-containing protein [Gemmatirosa sp.]